MRPNVGQLWSYTINKGEEHACLFIITEITSDGKLITYDVWCDSNIDFRFRFDFGIPIDYLSSWHYELLEDVP